MPPKSRTVVPIVPGRAGQNRVWQAGTFSAASPYRPIELQPRARTAHACDRCQELRTKCSGGVRCAKCTKDDVLCSYSDRKRERNKRCVVRPLEEPGNLSRSLSRTLERSVQQINDLQKEKTDALAALKFLVEAPNFQSDQHPDIVDLIKRLSDSPSRSPSSLDHSLGQDHGKDSSWSQPTENYSVDLETLGATSNAGESLAKADIGLPDRRRELGSAVDLDEGIGMPGYVGKMSDVSWIQRIQQYLVGITPLAEHDLGLSDIDSQALQTTTLSYFTEDHNLLAVDEDYIDACSMPSWPLAQVLTEAYIQSIQGAFRFIERKQFLHDLEQIYDTRATITQLVPRQRWTLALANVMWAIGSKWMEMTQLDRPIRPHIADAPEVENQLVYYARARSLGLDHRMQIDHPSLETVQGMATLSFYLLSNGSVHKAWSTAAQTVRHAIALGLHLKVAPGVFSEAEIQQRSRIWWSLFRMEVLLSEITGRPMCMNETVITVPFRTLSSEEDEEMATLPELINRPAVSPNSLALWKTWVGDRSQVVESWTGGTVLWSHFGSISVDTSESHFTAALELSSLNHRIGSILYLSPTDSTWSGFQSTVRDLEAELARWQEDLPKDLSTESIGGENINSRANLGLEMTLCIIRMILYRPFICEIHIEDESSGSTGFNLLSARAGVIAAIHMMDIMPDDPVTAEVLRVFPWWTLLHNISQTTAIFCLELCLNVQHMQGKTQEVMAALCKALNYLWVLAPASKSAYRAWNIHRRLVGKVAQKYGRNILTSLPLDAAKPRNWSDADEHNLRLSILKLSQ